jgi:hypothetical protein
VRQRIITSGLVALLGLASASCGEVARTGRSPVLLVIDSLGAATGDETEWAGFLLSDVLTEGSVVNDNGRAIFRLTPKNPGNVTSPLGPSALNEVTLTRYRVRYIRSDGRNREGIDVPYAFDGGITATINMQNGGEAVFLLVRHSAKEEPPLKNMAMMGGLNIVTTIAEVTFYGRDQAGNEVSAVGNITISFGDFADPD